MRLDIAVVYTDGRKEVVTVGRPADLIAFAEEFDKLGPQGPKAVSEIAWLTHRALRVPEPLDAWIDTLDDITADPDTVAEVRKQLDHPTQETQPMPSVIASRG